VRIAHDILSLPSGLSALVFYDAHGHSRRYSDEVHDDIGGRLYSQALDSRRTLDS